MLMTYQRHWETTFISVVHEQQSTLRSCWLNRSALGAVSDTAQTGQLRSWLYRSSFHWQTRSFSSATTTFTTQLHFLLSQFGDSRLKTTAVHSVKYRAAHTLVLKRRTRLSEDAGPRRRSLLSSTLSIEHRKCYSAQPSLQSSIAEIFGY